MTKPYREGAHWSFRLRIQGQDIYRSGFTSLSDARRALDMEHHALTTQGRPALAGPWKTTLSQALQIYAQERLPNMKGASQDASRINRYLRIAELDTIKVMAATAPEGKLQPKVALWTVELIPAHEPRKIPSALSRHRQAQATQKMHSDQHRKMLANTCMADVTPHQIQSLVQAMEQDGYSAATIGLERALLRRLFSYARQSWNWAQPARNPAQGLKLPKIDNARDRVLCNREWDKICQALQTCSNTYVAPALAILLETAMRSSEALVSATWADFDAARCTLRLREAKAGWRDVPMGPGAMQVMAQLSDQARKTGPISPNERILPITYEALKAAWYRVCERAGVVGVKLHDLRHTCATRFALELNGNMPVLKIITGHKTDSQLLRYINIKTDDVVRLIHGRALDEASAPAGYRGAGLKVNQPQIAVIDWAAQTLPSNVVPFARRSA